ncbi:MAG: EAL domain-containing protein [Dechloromonas sp.]|uniref:EAL domain-containing protein n=1 Tax=Candidatus Dechloromonas phosphorivorans TaxID=2899244 RepID=A0A935JXZ1_9RHOO|nr:EAL domain-containing protein [Candidatus Dechloromonas phosphorivorans]
MIISLLALLAVSSWRFIVGADWLVNMVLAFTLSGVGLLLWFEWRKLRSIRQAYDMAMLAAHDGFWEWNPITKELHTGTRLLEILGYQHDFLPDTHAWLKLVHPDDISIYNNAVSEHLKGNSNFFYCEYRVRASNGSYIWVASRGIAVRDRRGRAYQMVGSVTDISERRNYQETMEFLAQHDDLTGLPNRLMLAEKLAQSIEQAQQSGQRLAICFIDLDRFKNINDTLGHRAGDQLLQSVALRLGANLPANCQLFRQGGDEFIVLMTSTPDLSTVLTAAGQLRELIATPFTSLSADFFTSASIGISLFPDDASDGETLLKNADTAMYEAKAAGGNAVRTHTPQMNQRLLSRVTLETQLRSALPQNELALHFQAQVDTVSGRLTGAEALLRWQHEGQNIPPDQFIPVAEDTGLIIAIGDWVIDRAIAQILEWRHLYGDIPPIAINLSPRQFWRPALSHLVLDKLRAAGLPASALEVEVTESVLLHAEAGSLEELQNFRESGVRIALDDFGTGYSSLSYLRRLPINILKIDRSFIIDLTSPTESATSQALVRAIIAMAHSLSLKVIAEGVETPEQLACLKELDCDVIQGYLISRPLPPAEFSAKFLVDRNNQ